MSAIIDGTGSGSLAEVTSDNKLRAYATIETEISFESETNQRAYAWTATYAYAGNDTVILVKNTSTTLDLIIDRIVIASNAATQAIIHCPVCAVPTGTAITGVNLNRTSNNVAEATAIQDETTNVQANVIGRVLLNGAVSFGGDTKGAIVLGLNNCLAVDMVTAGTCYVGIQGYYHTPV